MKLSDFTFEQQAQIRHKCQTDLFFLGKDILNKDFVEGTHRAMCDFYVRKDPSFKTFKAFAQQYQGPRDRIQLVPRGTYKSSIKVVDNVQWIINWPEIRILSITSTQDLSTAFIDELSKYFTVRGKAQRNPDTNLVEGGRPTFFQELFPQHCITESEGSSGEFWTPARAQCPPELLFKDPTAGVLSIESSTSGWHCDVMDNDDPVSDRNSETANQLEKLENRIAMIYELLMNYGFRHTVATRYHPQDPYGQLSEAHGVKELYGDYESTGLKYMARPCWWLKGTGDGPKPTYAQPDYKTWVPKEEDVDLFFPEGAPFEALKKKLKNPKTFFSQQLNDPQESAMLSFTPELIRKAIVDHSGVPKIGTTFIAWDFAFVNRSHNDYSVGVVGLLDEQRRWWITNIIRGRFNFSDRVFHTVEAIARYSPKRTAIEDVLGTRDAMTEPLNRQAQIRNVPLDIDWISLGRGTDDAKLIRMSTLHPWLSEGRLFFVSSTISEEDLSALQKEFVNIGNRRAKNDIPDAIAHLVEQYSRYAAEVKAPEIDDVRQWNEMAERDFHNMIFRKGKYANVEAPPVEAEEDEGFTDSMTGLPSPYAI